MLLANILHALTWGRHHPVGRPHEDRLRRRPALEPLELRLTPALHLDLGTAISPVTPGYTRFAPALYSPATGYGWDTLAGITAFNRAATKPLTRDGHLGTNQTFLVDLPNGDYQVTATLGDPRATRDRVALSAEGVTVASGITTAAGRSWVASFVVPVRDGQLNLTLQDAGGANRSFALDALDVAPFATPGLVAAYGFEEGSGTATADASGTGNTATVLGATWSTSGKYGRALWFDGVNDWVTVADSASLDLTTGMTLEAWVKPAAINGWETVALKEASGELAYALYADNHGDDRGLARRPSVSVRQGGTTYWTAGTARLALNTWAHLAATYDGSTLQMYVNGKLATSLAQSGSINVSGGALRIGGNSLWSQWFKGLIDDVRVYGRALSAAEVQADMSTPVPRVPDYQPTANAGPDQTAGEGASVTFSGQATGLSGLTYLWAFGDGATATTLNAAHAYADNGSYTATLTVTDTQGRVAQDSAVVTVNNANPTATFGNNGPVNAGAAVTFTFSGQGDPSSADRTAGFRYSYDFDNDGTFDVSGSTSATTTFTFTTAGSYTVKGRIADKDGGFTDYTTAVTVEAPPPPSNFPNDSPAPPLPVPAGAVIRVSTVSALQAAVANLHSGDTLFIEAGTYTLPDTLYLPQGITNVAVRGATGNRGDVIIKGAGMSGGVRFGFWVGNVQGVTFGDFTVRDLHDHAFILNAGVESPLIHNVRMVDVGDQFVKANPDGAGGGVDNGVVEYCTIEYSTLAPDTYTNGVDVHTGNNWVIRNNVFRNIRAQGGLAGPAVLMWNGSQNTVTQGNTFINNQRDIAYGLTAGATPDHSGGVIRNNFIWRAAGVGGDVAIGVWNSPNTKVLNNTVLLGGNYPNALEYRFATTTGVEVRYNLSDAAFVSRDGATGTAAGNVTNAQPSWFVNAAVGDLHLAATATAAIDKAAAHPGVTTDYDGQSRSAAGVPDVGADEYMP